MSVRTRNAGLFVGALAIAGVASLIGYSLGHTGANRPVASATPAANRTVLYWYDPMVPAQHFDKPGKSPFMDMQLVPRYASESSTQVALQIDPSRLQNLGVRYAVVERKQLAQELTAPGVLEFDQRSVAVVQARAAGFVQRVYGRAPGDVVRAGAPLADLLVPSWGSAQIEYLAVRRTGDAALEAAARQRLRLLGMPEGLIASVARTGKTQTVVTITTPLGGAIQALDVRQGTTVTMGQTLAQVSGLGTVWLTVAIPEAEAGVVRVGSPVRVELSAFPGQTLSGRVSALLPAAQAESRTLQARIELPNRDGRLRPGMFGTAHLSAPGRSALVVPSEAVIRTGKRALVMLAGASGRFDPVEVQAGRDVGDKTEILAGLDEDQRIVASGQFLIDSEASLSGLEVRPLNATTMSAKPSVASALYRTRGRIEAVKDGQITLSHAPVPAIGWPAMTMTFALDPPSLVSGLKVGDHVSFGFMQKPAGPVVRQIAPEHAR